MVVQKFISFKGILAFAGFHFVWLAVYAAIIAMLHQFLGWQWLTIPWVPIALIGTAVAFYLGFKNSQAYDRMWEARKIWELLSTVVEAGGQWLMHKFKTPIYQIQK